MSQNRRWPRFAAFTAVGSAIALGTVFGVDVTGAGNDALSTRVANTPGAETAGQAINAQLTSSNRPTTTTTVTSTTKLSTTTTTAAPTAKLAAAVASYIKTRSGTDQIAIYDETTGKLWTSAAAGSTTTFETASAVKAMILVGVLEKAQNANRSLTAKETTLLKQMISVSDNNAASALWTEIGNDAGATALLKRIGTEHTTAGAGDQWGLTETTAADQVKVMRVIAQHNSVLTDANRTLAQSFLKLVTPSQHWGVSAGTSDPDDVLLKNGWLPHGVGWDINSVGYVNTGENKYVIAVMTKGNATEAYGIATVEGLSKIVWGSLN